MDIEELNKKHPSYKSQIDDWNLYQTAYKGGRNFIEYAITQHPRETSSNAALRRQEAIVFNYAASIINLFSFYLTEKDAMRNIGALANDTQWQMFRKDCDLFNTDFNVFINNAQKVSSIYGSVGVLVDKANVKAENKATEIENNIYPYCNLYTLPNILDWEVKRNRVTGRPTLVYLKILNHDGNYLIWRLDSWQEWEVGQKLNSMSGDIILVDEGPNPLGEIPFFWFLNIRSPIDPFAGISDIAETARISASIVRDLSSLQEIIKFAGFPMMRKPMREETGGDEDVAGPRSILEFDPEMPASKPDWLESAVLDPVRGGLEFIERKIDEIYEMAHMSGVHAMEKSSEARSGVALRYQFSQLSAVLTEKTRNMIEAEYAILHLWLKWQNMAEIFPTVEVRRSKRFSIDDMTQDIDNLLRVQEASISKTCVREVQRVLNRAVLPDLSDNIREEIDKEIDEADIVLTSEKEKIALTEPKIIEVPQPQPLED
jgi:hypothetical protein